MSNVLTMPPREDSAERAMALDVARSWIVEAPAGSGKTGLLLQRYLALLGSEGVTAAEQVLAITFTRAAAAEIRSRLLEELRAAAAETAVDGEYAARTRELARAVLARDAALGWGLLEDARRLRVQTIDALCAEIARAVPVLRRDPRGLRPTENTGALYREAARRTLLRLGREETEADRRLTAAITDVLLHRDGDLAACEELLAEMLASREQWGRLLPLGLEELTDEALDREVRPKLDGALRAAVCEGLERLRRGFPAGALDALAGLAQELGSAEAAKPEEPHPFLLCRDLVGPPAVTAEFLEHWRALLHLLLTKNGGLRQQVNRGVIGVEMDKPQKEALKAVIASIAEDEALLELLNASRSLPPATYPEDQWAVAKSLFRVLSQAVTELERVFDERGACDFVEPALVARAALAEGGGDGGRTLLGVELKHLLVDEMQDTSSSQYQLLEELTAGWDRHTRTVFLVGDPKQSIYLFRQARVERFVEAMRVKRLGLVPLGLLRLTANFRSRRGLVEAANETFGAVFPQSASESGQVAYTAAVARRGEGVVGAASGYAWQVTEATDAERSTGSERSKSTESSKGAVMAREARRAAKVIRRSIEEWMARPLPPGRTEPWRVAVLVQNRKSVGPILRALRMGEPVPFRAVNIESLEERREILDLLALTRALLRPGDRIAWLAVLHAPWCGLGLRDLHVLTGEDAEEFAGRDTLELIEERGAELGAEGIARLERVWPILRRAVGLQGELRVPELVARTWRSLGGHTYLEGAAAENAETYLQLLRSIDRETGEVRLAELERRLKKLFAAPASGAAAVELMTIHGSKGLEWDVVVVPQMERTTRNAHSKLLEWEELSDGRGVVLAPIQSKGEDAPALNKWLRWLNTTREKAERKRLLYVACTRAREELHLVGTVLRPRKGELKPQANSLLEVAWPAAAQYVTEMATFGEESGLSLAAAADEEFHVGEERPAMLERVPAGFAPVAGVPAGARIVEGGGDAERRAEGSFAARALGNVVHAVLEMATARFASGRTTEQVRAEAAGWLPRYRALLRAEGLAPREVDAQAERVRLAVERTLGSAVGVWILAAEAGARAELPLTTWGEERRTHRVDRVFLGGAVPGAAGATHRWVIDYKTATHGREGMGEFLAREQARYSGQMARYAEAMAVPEVRLGLWFPLLGELRWWVWGRAAAGEAVQIGFSFGE